MPIDSGETGWSVRISPYYTHVTDYIDVVKLKDFTDMMGMPTGFAQLQFANQDAEIYGIDVSGAVPLWSSERFGKTRLNAKASWLRGRNISDGASLYHQMPFNGSVSLEHSLGGLETQVQLSWAADKDRVDPTRNEPRTQGYALVDAQIAYSWKTYRVTLAAENLLDKAYFAPLGGISLGDYGATGMLRPVPGRGRSINVGFGVKF